MAVMITHIRIGVYMYYIYVVRIHAIYPKLLFGQIDQKQKSFLIIRTAFPSKKLKQ